MGIIRNGITTNNTDLTEFKRNTATVQQQMQSQISDLRDKLTDAYTEIANMKKTKSQFEQEAMSASCETLVIEIAHYILLQSVSCRWRKEIDMAPNRSALCTLTNEHRLFCFCRSTR